MTLDSGWRESARAYIAFQDNGNGNRTLLLDPVMLRLCGDVAGHRVLDVGCGEGRFGRMLAALGARVVGLDPIDVMATVARERGGPDESFVRAVAESMPFAVGAFDLVVSYITLVDIAGYREAITEIARVARPGGHVVVANLGFAMCGAWERDEDGRRMYRKIDRYLDEWSQVYEWAGIRIVNWHRPLSAYMSAYLGAGLRLEEFLEPVPEDVSLREEEWAEDWFRVPEFTVMKWQKPA